MLTPEEQAEYDALIAEKNSFSQPSQETEVRGFLPRLGRGIANIPGDLMAMPSEALRGIAGIFGRESTQEEKDRLQRLRTGTPGFTQMDAPQGAAEIAGDIVPVIGRELALLAAPASKAATMAELAGLGPRAAGVVGQLAAGGLSGIRQSGKESALQAGEFALGQTAAEFIPGGTVPKALLRAAAQAAVPLAGQVARGNEITSKEGLIQAGVQAGMQLIHDRGAFRSPKPMIKRAEYPPEASTVGRETTTPVREQPIPQSEEEAIFQEMFPRREVPPPRDDLSTAPQTEGDLMTLIPRKPNAHQVRQTAEVHGAVRPQPQESAGQVPSEVRGEGVPQGRQAPDETTFVGTAIRTPSGVVTGESIGAAHPTMMMKALDAGTPFEEVESSLGFAFRKSDGTIEWVDRAEAGRRLSASGQVKGLKPGENLTSEHIRGEVPGVTFTPAAKASPKDALRKSMGDARERLNAARALGDPDEIASIEGEIKVIGRAMRQAEEGRTKIPLKKPESRLMLPLGRPISGAIGGSIGYMTGDTDEERNRNALIGVTAGLLGPYAAKRLMKLAPNLESAARQSILQEGTGKRNLIGSTVRTLEKYFDLNKTPELKLAQEKGRGAVGALRHDVQTVLENNRSAIEEGLNNPAHKAAGDQFLNSSGSKADIAALDASSAPQGFKDALKAMKAAQREAQPILASGENDPSKRALFQSTRGSYQTTVYKIHQDPKNWRLDEAKMNEVLDQMQAGPLKDFERGTIEKVLREGLEEARKGIDPAFSQGGNTRIKQTLFEPKMDLTPNQWGFIDQMSKDPRMPAGAGSVLASFFTSKSIDPAGQKFLKAMAGNRALSDSERSMFREMADKQILTQEYRDLLGVVTDPFQRQLYTLNKLFGSVAQAKTISEISDAVLPTGARLAYGSQVVPGATKIPAAKIWENAKADAIAKGDSKLLYDLEGYRQLPEAASFGKMSGAYVPRDVYDAMTDIASKTGPFLQWLGKANNWAKEAATAWNPSTQARQMAQSPIFMLAARVWPWEVKTALKNIAADTSIGSAMGIKGGMIRELREQNIIGANYSSAELKSWADTVMTGKKKGLFSKARSKILGAYGIPDDLVRAASYIKHKARFETEGAAQGLTGDALERFARDKATTFTNERTMNYGSVSKAVRIGRNIPLVSPFLSYSAELARVTKNLAKDIATGSPSEKIWAGFALATMYGAPMALAEWGKNKFLKPEERKEWENTEELLPDAQRQTLKLPVGKNREGSFRYVNLNPLMPAGDMVSMVRAAVKGDVSALAAQQPFFGWQKSPLLSAAGDALIKEEHSFTGKKLDTAGEKVGRFAEAVTPSWMPGGFLYKRYQKSFSRNEDGTLGQIDPRTGAEYNPQTAALSTVGVGVQMANRPLLIRRAQATAREKVEDATREYRSIISSGAPSSQKQEAQQKFLMKRRKIEEELNSLLGP